MIKGTVDRIEGDWIIIVPESGPVFQVPVSLFPDAKEGDVVTVSIEKDLAGQNEAKERIDEIRKGLNRIEL